MRAHLVVPAILLIALAGSARAAEEDDEKAETWAKMHRTWDAIMAYKKDHGQVPDWLSDLIPRYLPDADALLSPTEKRTGRHGDFNRIDPKVRNSFCYEFSVAKYRSKTATVREAKEAQMMEYGPVVPILRCFLYDRVLNIAYSGDAYESPVTWENSQGARALMARLGEGPGFADGEFTAMTVVDAESGAPLADAEVRLTNRWYRSLWYPDRTLRTTADGTVRIPLGPADPPSRRVTVTVSKAGYHAPAETWVEGKLPEESVFGMERADTIGGTVKLGGSAPLAGAQIVVAVVTPGADGKTYRTTLATVVSGADGRWSCDQVPKKHPGLWLGVNHPAVWSGWFPSAERAAPGKVSLASLRAGTTVMNFHPAAVLRGTVTGADGHPAAGAEVFAVAKSPARTDSPDTPPAPVKTDAGGRYTMPWCEAGRIALFVFPSTGAPARIELDPTYDMEARDIQLAAGRTIQGRIVDEAGQPVSGAELSLARWGGVSVPGDRVVAKSDADGNYSWTAAPSESVELRLTHERYFEREVTVASEAAEPRTVCVFRRTP